jgi:small subunit ribosomal protein S20
MAKEEEKIKKVKRPTPLKRDLQNEKRRLINKAFRSSVRTAIRRFEECEAKKDAAAIKESLSDVYSIMDKGVKKGIYKQNTASRTKARLTARAAALKA